MAIQLKFIEESYVDSTTSVTYDASTNAAAGGIGIVIVLVYIAVLVLMIASMWMVFRKAGKPGWASIVPFYNTIVELEIIGRPAWWLVLLFIPFVNIVIAIIMMLDLAKSFGQSTGMGVLLVLLPVVGMPLLAFNKSISYVGPAATAVPVAPAGPPAPIPPASTDEPTPPRAM